MTDSNATKLLGHPAHLLELSRRLIADGQAGQAVALAHAAIGHGGNSGLLRAIGREILSHKIAGFHGSMLRDDLRNHVYAAGIAAAAAGRTVLDIGAGTGLLAMIAARAGARHVYACEVDQRLAMTAQEIVAANGLADRVTILPVHSEKLDRDCDLGGGVDLVISEIFGDDLLSEGALPSLNDARRRLCTPDATFLPSKAAIRVALVGTGANGYPARFSPVTSVEDFDLSLINRHLSSRKRISIGTGNFELRSDSADLFAFDFNGASPTDSETSIIMPSRGGLVTGVAQWIWFEVGANHEYENRPAANVASHWHLHYYAFEKFIETQPGQPVKVHAWQDGKAVFVWRE